TSPRDIVSWIEPAVHFGRKLHTRSGYLNTVYCQSQVLDITERVIATPDELLNYPFSVPAEPNAHKEFSIIL
nr:hypothetical protein [Thermoproteota archaeon]